MDIRKIKKLIELLDESGVAEIEIHEGEESVRISRNASQAQVVMPAAAPYPAAPIQVRSRRNFIVTVMYRNVAVM